MKGRRRLYARVAQDLLLRVPAWEARHEPPHSVIQLNGERVETDSARSG